MACQLAEASLICFHQSLGCLLFSLHILQTLYKVRARLFRSAASLRGDLGANSATTRSTWKAEPPFLLSPARRFILSHLLQSDGGASWKTTGRWHLRHPPPDSEAVWTSGPVRLSHEPSQTSCCPAPSKDQACMSERSSVLSSAMVALVSPASEEQCRMRPGCGSYRTQWIPALNTASGTRAPGVA